MRVAVLMSSYNGEKYIREQIESILVQKGNFELNIWVRDDGSSDKTQSILREYEREGKLQWYTGENIKPARSFMDLINHCKGYDYYAFADQDDYWLPEKINCGITTIGTECKPVLYFSNAYLVDAELKMLGRNVYRSTPKTDFYTLSCAGGYLGCTMVFNKHLAEIIQTHSIPQNMIMHDFFTALVCSSTDGKIIYDAMPTMKYRQHGNNVVGVSHGIMGTMISRIHTITCKEKVSIAEQAEEIVKIYGDNISEEKRIWLTRISRYKHGMNSRVCLACSHKTKYMNFNMGMKLRLAILLGNR